MAIYVYITTSGVLHSYIPDNITIAEAQASGQLASNARLALNGMTAVDNLPPQDASHQWDPASKTVITVVPPPTPMPLPTFFFIMRFTATEWVGIKAATSDRPNVRWLDAIQCTNIIDLADSEVQSFVNNCETKGYIAPGRANTILTTPVPLPLPSQTR